MITKAERLQLEAALDRVESLYLDCADSQRADLSYVAARLTKVLSGHSKHR